MKHNENLFNISSKYYKKIEIENDINEDISNLQKEVLKILMKRFRNILEHETKYNNGILKTKIRYRSNCRDGYKQIDELVKSGNFDSFAIEYCVYLGKVVYNDDNDNYYEIIWDYKTYFEVLSMSEIQKGIDVKVEKNDKSDFTSTMKVFNSLPQKYKLSAIKSFITSVKKQKTLFNKDKIEQECLNKGHAYSEWERIDYECWEQNPYLGSRDYYVPEGHKYIKVPHTKWERTCNRCGLVETETVEPKCVEKARLEKEKREKIKQLRKELKELEEN